MALSAHDISQLRAALQDAVIKCSERCLYQSAKWAAELLMSLPEASADDTHQQSQNHPAPFLSPNPDPDEARLEAREVSRYLLAKTLFDCKEYDRCASVFLPDPLNIPVPVATDPARDVLRAMAMPRNAAPSVAGAGGTPLPPRWPPAGRRDRARDGKGKGKGKARIAVPYKEEREADGAGKGVEMGAAGTGTGTGMGMGERGEGEEGGPSETKAPPLQGTTKLPDISQKSLFLALYAKFLSGEKRKNEETEMIMGPFDLGSVVNKHLVVISRLLEMWFESRRTTDDQTAGSQGWLEYLYGIVLAKEKSDSKSMEYFIRSVHIFPMNWGCWLEMTSLISRVEELNRVSRHLPQNIVSYMFHLHTSLELYQHGPSLAGSLDQLLAIFPTSSFLLGCNAMLSYHAKDLLGAEHAFGRLMGLHPHRLDGLDHYSNILYVMNNRPKLAFLAHLCSGVDKFRPESCVVVGNYYSLLSMHEKAVQYFRRALTLDRSCLSAWTLMGHEYVELKNTHAAIESYRRAVDVNRRDYRAWYGLGQTYEMLEMHTYSLWYYKKAAGLRPWDGKMWQAVGGCLQRMGRDLDGIKSLKRALLADASYEGGSSSGGGDSGGGHITHMDPEILLQIAVMYERLGEEDETRAYMEMCIAQEDGSGSSGSSSGSGSNNKNNNSSKNGKPPNNDNDSNNNIGRLWGYTTYFPFAESFIFPAEHPDGRSGSDGEIRDFRLAAADGGLVGIGAGGGITVMGGIGPRRSPLVSAHLAAAGGHGGAAGGSGGAAGGNGGASYGTGVTIATSTARKWLARHAMQREDYETANRLATELCQDGVEIEDAKALIREIRVRMDVDAAEESG